MTGASEIKLALGDLYKPSVAVTELSAFEW
jgi:hypothetical protein